MAALLTIELFAHMDAGDRTKWTAPQDTRPLTPLGRAQAERLCQELAASPIAALYSSPALRCRQSIEPLASTFGLEIEILDGLHESDGWQPPPASRGHFGESQGAHGGAYTAGAGMRALSMIRERQASGRVAACTHGDVLPAVVMYLAGAHQIEVPAPNRTRGGWYTLVFDRENVEIRHHDVLDGFPLA